MKDELDQLLIGEEPQVRTERTQDSKTFNPKFNVREEFVLWINEQFPELKQYAKKKQVYDALETRRQEIYQAALGAVNHGTESTQDCANARLKYGWNAFETGFKAEANPRVRARSLKKFVESLEDLSLSLGGNQHFTDCGRSLDGRSYSGSWFGNLSASVYRMGDEQSKDAKYAVFEKKPEAHETQGMTLIGELIRLRRQDVENLKEIATKFKGTEKEFRETVDRAIPEELRPHEYTGGSYGYGSLYDRPLARKSTGLVEDLFDWISGGDKHEV